MVKYARDALAEMPTKTLEALGSMRYGEFFLLLSASAAASMYSASGVWAVECSTRTGYAVACRQCPTLCLPWPVGKVDLIAVALGTMPVR